MRSWTTLKNDTAALCAVSTTDTAKMAVIGGYINDSIRTVASKRKGKFPWLFKSFDILTVAGQRAYQIPQRLRRVSSVLFTVGDDVVTGSTRYQPTPIFDQNSWNRVLVANLGESNWPMFYFLNDEERTLDIAPIPSTSDVIMTIRGRLNIKNLSIEDYTTGTIVSIAADGTAVVGSGTTWTADMVGRYIRITETTAANGGDGYWYEIGAFTDATHIALLKPYQGNAIAAGSAAYTIGQMSLIPESYDIAPVYRSAALYWGSQGDKARADMYWNLYDGGQEASGDSSKLVGGIIGQMLEESSQGIEGSYISPNLLTTRISPNDPQQAVGAGSFAP